MQGQAEQMQDGTVAPAPGGVLRRLIVANQRPDAPPSAPARTPGRSLERTISAAVSRAADRTCALPLFFDRVVAAHLHLAELPEYLPERALICLVEGAGDSLGVVSICPGLLASIIEMQAMGRVSSRPTPARRPTRADAAICADLVNAVLAELGTDLGAMQGYAPVRGFRYAGFLPDPRPLDLMLEDRTYRRLELKIRAGDAGQRDGTLTVILPLAAAAPVIAARQEAVPTADVAGQDAAEGADPHPPVPGPCSLTSVAAALRDSPVVLHGVLCRRQIGLGQLKALLAGQQISLPRSLLENATLETARGQVIAFGRLGESEGRHALRLRTTEATPGRRMSSDLDDGVDPIKQDPVGAEAALHALPDPDHQAPDPFRPGSHRLDNDPQAPRLDGPTHRATGMTESGARPMQMPLAGD